jgi:hypothetical protein
MKRDGAIWRRSKSSGKPENWLLSKDSRKALKVISPKLRARTGNQFPVRARMRLFAVDFFTF